MYYLIKKDCLYYVWIANSWIREKDNIEENRSPSWNTPWKVTFTKVKKHMVLFVLHIKSLPFRAWHIDQLLYVRQRSFQDNNINPIMDTSLKSIKGCLPQWSNLKKNEKKDRTRAQENYLKWNSGTNTTSSTLLLFLAKQSNLYLCLIVYPLYEC